MSSKYKQLIRDMGIFAVGTLGSKLIVFLLLPLYTHVLTTEEYGVADLVFTLGQLLLPVVSLAIFNGLLRYGLMQNVESQDALNCASKVYAAGCLIMILLTPLLKGIPTLGTQRWYLCGYVISSFAVSNNLVYLKVKDKNKLYALLSILQTLTLIICNVVLLVVLDYGVQGYLLSYIISNMVTAVSALICGGMILDLKESVYHSSLMRSMIVFSLPYILNDISWWAIHSSNKLFVEFLLGSAVLGIYTTASKIPSLVNVLASIFTQAWGLSSIKEYDSSNDTSFYSTVFLYFIIFVFGVCIVAVSVIKFFMKIYVSEAFFDAWRYIPLLLLGAVFSAISAFAGSLLGAMKKTGSLMWSTFVAGITNIALNLILIPICGLWGAAIGTLAAHIIVAIIRLISVQRILEIDYHLKKSIPVMIIAVLHVVFVSMDFYSIAVSLTALALFISFFDEELCSLLSIFRKRCNLLQ